LVASSLILAGAWTMSTDKPYAAAGLFAAVPAAYFYNHLTNKVKEFASQMDDFALEFLNISERNFT